jgi:hypothetical protein
MRPLVATLAALAAVTGAGLATGSLPPGSPAASGQVRVVDEVAVTPMDLDREFSSNSPMLAAEPGQPRFVAMANRLDAPDFSCALQVSGNGGRTWVTAEPVPQLPDGAEKCYAPEVAFDADGTLYYLFVGLAGPGNRPMGAFLVTSIDRAQTFSPPRQVLGPLNFGVRMAIDIERGDPGRMHLVWIKATSDPSLGGFGPPPNPIVTAHSDDGGKTFSDPVQVSDAGRERVVAPALALGPDHAVHVAYYDLGRDAIDYQGLEGPVWEEPWSLVLASSVDGAGRFRKGRVVDDAILATERVMLVFTMPPPALVAGPSGLLCAAWPDARHGDADALARCSHDRGASWGPVRRLNDDRLGNGQRQYLPRLSLSAGGRLDAVFLDRRDDPRNVRNHVYLTHSTDGGRSFAPNRRISGDPSHSEIGQQYVHASASGQYEIGARLGLLSERSRAVAAWPDNRHWMLRTTGQDLFSATVALPDLGGPSLTARLAGLAFLVSGLGVLAGVAVRRRRGAA